MVRDCAVPRVAGGGAGPLRSIWSWLKFDSEVERTAGPKASEGGGRRTHTHTHAHTHTHTQVDRTLFYCNNKRSKDGPSHRYSLRDRATMSSTGRPAAHPQDGAEIDSVKESISDIINQLQDIDPARLSFSPFLDLDTQISLAPVSDSPESSVEELHSSPHSVTGSQRSLEPGTGPSADTHRDDDSRPDDSGTTRREQGVPEGGGGLSSAVATTAHTLEDASENRVVAPSPLLPPSPPSPSPPSAPLAEDLPNGTDPARWARQPPPPLRPHPRPQHPPPAGEGRPLLDAPPGTVELAVWMESEGRGQGCDAVVVAPDALPPGGRRCCRRGGRAPALGAAVASLVCAAGILYALYFHVPLKAPRCPDLGSRLVFTLGCCLVASLPVLLAMLSGWVCQFCSGSLEPAEPSSRRRALQRLFVSSSLELLLLYALNLLLMASQLPQRDLHLVPTAAAIFFLGRLVYWASLHGCPTWRAFGAGLTTFPLLAMVALNLFFLYNLGLEYPAFRSQDLLLNQDTPSLWSPGAMAPKPNATLDNM
ncbi:transmembrane protein 79 [Gadus morhua]|uniref:Transmembrane protein 79-like n=1 Tax=Gadus morhua TaxID=8049 RepID=A0A8C5ASD5_GADMO|nr:transmembrane protein 79-like [Gadus morhua]